MKLSVWIAISDLVPLRHTLKEKVIAFFDKKSAMFVDLPCGDIFRSLKQAGVDGVELLLPHFTSDKAIVEAKALLERNRMSVLSIHQPLSGSLTIPLIERFCTTARLFSASVVVLHSGSLGKRLLDNHFVSTLKALQKKYKVTFGIENMENSSFSSEVFTFRGAEFSSVIKKDGLSMTFDVTHLAQVGEDVLSFYRKNQERIVNIHLSDYKRLPVQLPIVSRFTTHLSLGAGTLPIREFLILLKESKYKGLVTMEINSSLSGLCESADLYSSLVKPPLQ